MKDLLDLVREQYFWEAQRRDRLNSASSLPIGFATLAGTIAISVASGLSSPFSTTELVILTGLGLALVASCYALYQVIRFFMGPIYKYVANAEKVRSFWHSAKIYYESYPEVGKLDQAFDEFLVDTYATCAAVNCQNNDAKSRRLYRLNVAVLWMLVPCVVSGVVLVLERMFLH